MSYSPAVAAAAAAAAAAATIKATQSAIGRIGRPLAVFHSGILLAARGNNHRTEQSRAQSNSCKAPTEKSASPGFERKKGRQRYAPNLWKHQTKSQNNNYNYNLPNSRRKPLEFVRPIVPLLTEPDGPFPTYFTCRHTFEDTLMEEIRRYAMRSGASVRATSPCPGLVAVEGLPHVSSTNLSNHLVLDPVYALQVLPSCRIVEYANSIKGLARQIADIPDFGTLLAVSPKGSLSAIHALVPGMCKGQKDPIWNRRCRLVTDAVIDQWRKQYPAARNQGTNRGQEDVLITNPLLLQVFLLSPDVAAVSLAPCHVTTQLGWWPNPHHPAGMADVDVDSAQQNISSSAYRKLLEAFACLGARPSGGDTVVDLGASPGGWTSALLVHCNNHATEEAAPIRIIAVDRAPLDPNLMMEHRVTFVRGDAFAFQPVQPVAWMVSDIVAYPERIVQLVDHWCQNHLAINMVVTMKFRGDDPSWDHLDRAVRVANSHGYMVRAKHFFNNKNEITLMLRQLDNNVSPASSYDSAAFPPVYKLAS